MDRAMNVPEAKGLQYRIEEALNERYGEWPDTDHTWACIDADLALIRDFFPELDITVVVTEDRLIDGP